MWKEGWGLSEEQKRRSPPAAVIGLPRLSFLRDQSHRSCLLPNCWTNQLSYRPLISCLYLSVGKTICTETPVVVEEQRVWHVCVRGGAEEGGCSGWRGLTFKITVSRSFQLLLLNRDQDCKAWADSTTLMLLSTEVFMCQSHLHPFPQLVPFLPNISHRP